MLKIGKLHLKNNILLAPMEGVNCKAFRQVCHEYGAGLVATPMILVNRFVEDRERQLNVVNFSRDEHPLMVQIGGADGEMIKQTVQYINEFADVIDLNLGCPEPDVLALKAGCFFIKHPEQLKKCMLPIMNNTNKPVTVKIRIGWDERSINTVQVVKALEDFGVAAITVHGRTRDQSYRWQANWEEIRKAKEIANVPIIGNGDILQPIHAKMMIEQTGCDGVMIARGAKGNPILFQRTALLLEKNQKTPEPSEIDKINSFMRFADYYSRQPRKSITEFRQHALWFTDKLWRSDSLRKKIEKLDSIDAITDAFRKSIRF